jgi:two-component system phosphate regulon sensor histidine kinase PhoR
MCIRDRSIIDTGHGISAEDLPKLGQKFYRAGNYINADVKVGDKVEIVRPGGTGLGLFVTFNLIRKMGGDIRVESEVGKGSKFIFTLPIYKSQAIHDHNGDSKNMFEKLGLKKQ